MFEAAQTLVEPSPATTKLQIRRFKHQRDHFLACARLALGQ